jgi:threonine/homoserine/homoserine lactone efflux protein
VAYLCWLGVRALWASRRGAGSGVMADGGSGVVTDGGSGVVTDREPGERWSAGRALRVGLTTNLLNPKVGVFYLSVLPPFLPDGVNPLLASLALAAVHAVEGLLWLSLLAVLVTRAKGWLDRPSVRRRFEQVTGLVLVGFGLRLAFDHRPA